MKSFLKKLVIIAITVATTNITVDAQKKGDMAVGANLVFTPLQGPVILLGAGTKFQYNVSKPFRLESSFNYLFERDFVSRWDLYLNGHFLIPIYNQTKIYPIIGFGILGCESNYPVEEDEWSSYGGRKTSTLKGFSMGGGIDIKITDKLFFNAEYSLKAEAKINDAWSATYFVTGIVYRF